MGFLWLPFVAAMFALVLGVLVFRRSPRHPAHASFGIGMTLLAAETVVAAVALHAFARSGDADWQRLRLMIATLLPAPWIVFSRTYSRGDALMVLQGRGVLLGILALGPLAFAIAFRDNLVMPPSPAGDMLTSPQLRWAGSTIEVLLLLTSVLVLTHLERTFRGSVGVMRWRVKYIVLGVAVLFGFRLYATSQAVLFRAPDESIGNVGSAALLVGCVLITVGLNRGKLFDVDVYPSQTLVYGSLTVLLAGTYLIILGVLSHVVTLFGGASALPFRSLVILVGLAGLAVLLLSERFRQQLRQFVSRHLRRPVYDYRRVWSTFTTQTTSLVDEGAFCRAVASWASETFQALSASVWLVEDSGDWLRLGGSTVLGDSASMELDPSGDAFRETLEQLAEVHGPILLDDPRSAWAASLQRLHPDVFHHGGQRVCQPLHAGGKLLGVLILGDRVSGLPFTTEDFDLLRCVGDQVAASLLGLQLSAQLLRTKEMEAFQTMSAFFVHDLKNTVSTLSLTLQNLDQHFSDPAFREDARRAVSKSVQHLNGLIARLSRLREEMRVQPAPGDLVAVVEAALSALGSVPSVHIEKELDALPPVMLDAEQLEKVVLNLLVNAREAIGGEGSIRVATSRSDGWASLAVTDTGCGMSPEFVRRSLFRPFQTTKKNGLGIGMFHSKMIVEAHRGRMEVDSAPGKGTTVRVLLPLAGIV